MTEATGIKEIIKPENLVYKRSAIMTENILSYCPGCGHGTVHRILAELIEEEGLQQDTIGISPVGCSVLLYNFLDIDWQEAAHGRAPALATAIKRLLPDKFVFTYQGDGDMASIGMSEIMHVAARGENITVIFINNAIYGMTGGQMAPTTLPGQKTTTCIYGRDVETMGYPLHMSEVLSNWDGAGYIVRRSLHDPKNIRLAKKAIRTAFEAQKRGLGFSLVELLSTCNTNWGMTVQESLKWLEERMIPVYPIKDFKVSSGLEGFKA